MKKLFIMLILFTTSCMKYPDLGKLSIIKSIGISYENNYILYAEIYDDIEKDNKPKTTIIKATGKTINDTFNNLELLSKKEIFFSHIDLLIFNKNLKNNNYQEIINFFLNNKNFRNDFLCVFSTNIQKLLSNSKYDEIEDYLKTNKESKKTINISFDELANQYLNNQSFYLSMINYNDEITLNGNYKYINNKLERITNEKN